MAEQQNGEGQAARAFWSGTISFGLVSVPVDLFAAVRPARLSLRMLGPDGHPLSRRYFCPEHDRELSDAEIVRGYPIAGGEYVVVSDDELDALEPEKSRDIDLRRFVERASIEPARVERPYILAPSGESTKAYHLLAETMEREGLAGVATFVMRGREYLAAIVSEGGVLRALTLRFAGQLRTPATIGLPEVERASRERRRQLDAALDAIGAGELDVSQLGDESADELRELAGRKYDEGRDVFEVPEELAEPVDEGGAVIDIMSVLAERLGAVRAEPREDLSGQTKKALYERARELGIEGRSAMSKDQLIDAIRSSP